MLRPPAASVNLGASIDLRTRHALESGPYAQRPMGARRRVAHTCHRSRSAPDALTQRARRAHGGQMRPVRLLGALLAGTLACASGGSPDLETSWRDPSVSALHFRRVLVSYVSNDESVRRRVEDKLAKQIPNSFAAYRAAPDLNVRDRPGASALLREKMFDGAIVMRVVDAQ